MDETDLDLMTDALEDAPLSPQQRDIWQAARAELMAARLRIQTLESRIKTLSEAPDADGVGGTMILNRPDFNREAARMLAFDERYGTTSSVVYFALENYEAICVRHGNTMAEQAVRCVCDTLLGAIRRSDVLGRLASDEFGVLLSRCDNEAAWRKGEQLAGTLYKALSRDWGTTLPPTLSYGAYTFQDEKDIAGGLKKAAESLTRIVKQ